MTLLADDTSRSNGGGGLRDLRSVIAQAEPLLTGTNGHDRSVDGSRPARVRGAVQDFRPGSNTVSQHLAPLTALGSYQWFSEEYYRQACEWLGAVLEADRSHDLKSHAPARDAVRWWVAAILDLYKKDVDLYHRDRAEQAVRVVRGSQTPHRRADIPQHRQQGSRWYVLQMSTLRWSPDTPVQATNRLTELALRKMPDEWLRATYVERRNTWDPVIYARYGDWFVKVVEWP